MSKKWWVVFTTDSGKELCAYTAAETFSREAESTRALLAAENHLQPEEIKTALVYR